MSGGQGTQQTYSYDQRDSMASDLRSRLDAVDAKIAQLDERTDAKSKRAVTDLRQKRDTLAKQIEGISQQQQATWETFQSKLSMQVRQLEVQTDDALKG